MLCVCVCVCVCVCARACVSACMCECVCLRPLHCNFLLSRELLIGLMCGCKYANGLFPFAKITRVFKISTMKIFGFTCTLLYQRGWTDQVPEHAQFQHSRGSFSHTNSSIWHQCTFNRSGHFKLLEYVLKSCKSLCVQFDRTKLTCKAPTPWIGALHKKVLPPTLWNLSCIA